MRPYALGRAPPLSTRPEVALWPKIPLKNAGMRMLPPTSEPTPHAVPAADTRQPSPPEEPPTVRPVWYGLLERPNTCKGAFTTLSINRLQLYSRQWVTGLGCPPCCCSPSTCRARTRWSPPAGCSRQTSWRPPQGRPPYPGSTRNNFRNYTSNCGTIQRQHCCWLLAPTFSCLRYHSPAVQHKPLTVKQSLMVKGTPRYGFSLKRAFFSSSVRLCKWASTSLASARASSNLLSTTQFRIGLTSLNRTF